MIKVELNIHQFIKRGSNDFEHLWMSRMTSLKFWTMVISIGDLAIGAIGYIIKLMKNWKKKELIYGSLLRRGDLAIGVIGYIHIQELSSWKLKKKKKIYGSLLHRAKQASDISNISFFTITGNKILYAITSFIYSGVNIVWIDNGDDGLPDRVTWNCCWNSWRFIQTYRLVHMHY